MCVQGLCGIMPMPLVEAKINSEKTVAFAVSILITHIFAYDMGATMGRLQPANRLSERCSDSP